MPTINRRVFIGWTGLAGYGTYVLLAPAPRPKPPKPTTTTLPATTTTTTPPSGGSNWPATWPAKW